MKSLILGSDCLYWNLLSNKLTHPISAHSETPPAPNSRTSPFIFFLTAPLLLRPTSQQTKQYWLIENYPPVKHKHSNICFRLQALPYHSPLFFSFLFLWTDSYLTIRRPSGWLAICPSPSFSVILSQFFFFFFLQKVAIHVWRFWSERRILIWIPHSCEVL